MFLFKISPKITEISKKSNLKREIKWLKIPEIRYNQHEVSKIYPIWKSQS